MDSLQYRRVRRRARRFGATSPAFYDFIFGDRSAGDSYRRHYSEAPSYFLLAVVADRLRSHAKILEVGCGTGQLARLLSDQWPRDYVGVDFSGQALALARQVTPESTFLVDDALTTSAFAEYDYEVVVMMEVLEHIVNDLDLLRRVRTGARVVATVPSFDDPGHCRYFSDAEAVHARYRGVLKDLSITTYKGNSIGHEFYVLDGTATATS
jgi:2-polyprenyl-3-methyl-5-hydroxy-6-metoxy-1,4-benzoquinol methylase